MAELTAGQLREQLAKEGLPWTVNSSLADDDVVPWHATGADRTKIRRAEGVPRVNVAALVAANPTTNALLRADLVKRGIIAAAAAGELALGSRPTRLNRPSAQAPARTDPSGASGGAGAGGGGGGSLSSSVDWRSRYGWNWITEIRDQDPCEHCWIYASVALMEAMVRIEHCIWCTRSEGDYIEAERVPCGQCGSPEPVLAWAQTNAITDLECVPWVDRDPGDRTGSYWNPPPNKGCGSGSMQAPPMWSPCSNRDGRSLRVPTYTLLGNVTDEKEWVDNIGPLVCSFEVYSDFFAWSGTKPYERSSTAKPEGGHVVLIVGYDDTAGCWIIKNSWGTGWGDSGFGLIAYGQCGIDINAKVGIQLVNPDPWTKRRSHSGGMIESGDGALHRNFELMAPSSNSSVTHWWRDNSTPSLPWHKDVVLGSDASVHPPTFTSTTYNRNFEFVYPTVAGQLHHWWFEQSTQQWHDGEVFAGGVFGSVGFIESSYGPGNFEVVYRTSANQLQHWWRDNTPSHNWHQGPQFGSNVAAMGPALLQSTWGNLELVAVTSSGAMQHWWRDDAGNMDWIAGELFGAGVSSPPCMIQGQFGMANEYANGNFELCVAIPDGTVQHWWRDNEAPNFPWSHSATFASNVSSVIALIEGSFGFNLELIAILNDGNLQHFWRDDAGWNAGAIIGSAN
jgi:Papain family cysteine protease